MAEEEPVDREVEDECDETSEERASDGTEAEITAESEAECGTSAAESEAGERAPEEAGEDASEEHQEPDGTPVEESPEAPSPPEEVTTEPPSDEGDLAPPTEPLDPSVGQSEHLAELAARLDRVESSVRQLGETMESVRSLPEMTERILAILSDRERFDRAREVAVTKMHEDLRQYKEKGVQYVKKESLQNLLVLYDDIDRTMDRLEELDASEAIRDEIDWLRERILETLYREDVEPLAEEPSEVLDRSIHKVVKTVRAEKAEQNRTVSRIVKRGFLWHGELFRREHVEVRTYEPGDESPGEAAQGGPGDSATCGERQDSVGAIV